MNEQSYMTVLLRNEFTTAFRSTLEFADAVCFGTFSLAPEEVRSILIARGAARESSSLESPSYATRCLWEESLFYGTDAYYDEEYGTDTEEARREYERDIMTSLYYY